MSLLLQKAGPQVIAAGGGAFLPSDVAGLQVWTRPESLAALADGDPVGTWENEGALADLTQGTGAAKPTHQTNEVNGFAIVRLDGVDDSLDIPDLSALTAVTGFVVFKHGGSGEGGIWATGSAAATSHTPYSDNTVYDAFGSTVRHTTGSVNWMSAPAWHIYTVLSKSGNWTSWNDGAQLFTTATNTVGLLSTPRLGRGDANGSNRIIADVAELIVYDSDIGSTDRTSVWTYLEAKYSL